MKSVENANVEGKKVLLRTDLNLPIENGEPQKTVRFKRYQNTINELSSRGAKVIVVAHQGRPARKDFLSLEKHSEILAESIGKDVKFIPSFFGPKLEETVTSMDNGDIAMLENIRFLSEELQNASAERHAQDIFVKRISKHVDIYVDDAFSAAHRSHGSMVGFTETLDSYAGSIMEKELQSCAKIREEFETGVLVLGGEKPSDLIGIIKEMIDSVDKVLLGGIPGELALIAQGHKLGEKKNWIQDKGLDSREKELLELIEKHEEKILLPKDLATDSGNYDVGKVPENEITWDIGERTIELFVSELKDADAVMMKGPMGAFEEHPDGTKEIVNTIAENDGFTVLGGGHTSSLVQRFGHSLEEFSHVSIAGGAFVRYMSGEELPAVEALEK